VRNDQVADVDSTTGGSSDGIGGSQTRKQVFQFGTRKNVRSLIATLDFLRVPDRTFLSLLTTLWIQSLDASESVLTVGTRVLSLGPLGYAIKTKAVLTTINGGNFVTFRLTHTNGTSGNRGGFAIQIQILG